MSGKLEVSFNSPQCGWMSIGFKDAHSEFNTTTAHAPHGDALSGLLRILTLLLDDRYGQNEFVLHWNRDPEEFDLRFLRGDGGSLLFEVYQYPSDERELAERELVFAHLGTVGDVCGAFAETFEQLYVDRETDEFEFNWRQPFPNAEFARFRGALEQKAGQAPPI
jgi:hypothetical protein